MKNCWSSLLPFIFLTSICLNVHAFVDTSKTETTDTGKMDWSYLGNTSPDYWGRLNPAFILCDKGNLQSPINIPRKVINLISHLTLHYQSAPLTVVDNGLTQITLGMQQLIIHDGRSVQVNFSEQTKELITLDGETYRLLQFHFHSPSEEQLQSHAFPLEIHFVHQGANGKLLVIGVFVRSGQENESIKQIITHLPHTEGEAHTIEGAGINPMALMPAANKYYRYQGSLTTPPCSEGVEWIVMQDPITASSAQIRELRKAAGGANARPIQPLNNRNVYYSFVDEKRPSQTP